MSASFSMNFLFAVWWKTSSSATFCIFIAINLTHIGTGINNMVHFKKLNSPKSVVLLERRCARGIWFIDKIACVASVSVEQRAKNRVFSDLPARKMGRENLSLFWLSPHFSRGQNAEIPVLGSFFALCSTETLATQAIDKKTKLLVSSFSKKIRFLVLARIPSNCEKYPPFSRCFRARRAFACPARICDVTMSHTWISGCHGNVTEIKTVIF